MLHQGVCSAHMSNRYYKYHSQLILYLPRLSKWFIIVITLRECICEFQGHGLSICYCSFYDQFPLNERNKTRCHVFHSVVVTTNLVLKIRQQVRWHGGCRNGHFLTLDPRKRTDQGHKRKGRVEQSPWGAFLPLPTFAGVSVLSGIRGTYYREKDLEKRLARVLWLKEPLLDHALYL